MCLLLIKTNDVTDTQQDTSWAGEMAHLAFISYHKIVTFPISSPLVRMMNTYLNNSVHFDTQMIDGTQQVRFFIAHKD